MVTPDQQEDQSQETFEALMRQIAAGSESAAWQLVEVYGPHVRRAVRRNLNPKLRQQFDSLDFAQAVWASVFVIRTKLTDVDRPEQLIALLTTIARNKVVDMVRQRIGTKKYDVSREVSVDREGMEAASLLVSPDPSPSEFAIARERWESLMRDQPQHYRRIVALRLRGDSYREIAGELNISDKTVQRVLGKLLRERVG